MKGFIELFPAETFAERLLAAIRAEAKRHTQRKVAAAMKVSEPYLSQILKGRRNLSVRCAAQVLAGVQKLDRLSAPIGGTTLADSDGDDGA